MSWSSDHQISQKRVRFEINKGKRSPKGFSASNYDVGNWIFSKSKIFFEKLLGKFLYFFGNFLEDFLGGIFFKESFGKEFLRGFFGRIFGRNFLGGFFWEEFFVRNFYIVS